MSTSADKPTLYWQVIPNLIGVVVHTDVPPTDEEWETGVGQVAAHARELKGMLIYAAAAGPTSAQRARASALLSEAGCADLPMAIMSGSRLVRGIVTAFSWTMSGALKVFSTHDFEGAIGYFNFDSSDDIIKARLVLKQLARSAGIQIDAFADESGRFMRKYKAD